MSMYEAHPYADIFPMMTAEEHDNIAKDIAANGMREPIVLYQGKILDGRNRYDAWRQVMAIENKPPTIEYDGDEPLAYVISLNLHRRHLSVSQQSMVGANIAALRRGDFSGNQHVVSANLRIPTESQTASMLGISERTLQAAKSVQRDGIPELSDAVTAGEVSVSAAAQVAKLPEDEQRQAIKGGNQGIVDAAKAVRDKIKGMANQSNNEISQAARNWTDEQRELHTPSAMTERGELRRLVRDIESLKSAEYYRRHAAELGMSFHTSCSNAVEWLNRFLIIIDEEA